MLLLSLWLLLLLLPLKYLQRQPVLCSCLYYSKPPPQYPPHKKACWITTNAEMNRHPAKKRTNPTNWMWLCMSVFGFVGFKLHLYLYSYLFSFFSRHCCQDKSFRVIVMAVVVVVLKCLQSVGRSVVCFVFVIVSIQYDSLFRICMYLCVCLPPSRSMWIRTWIRQWIHWDTIAKPNRFLAIIYLTMLLMQFPLHFATNIYKYSHIHTYIVHTYIHAYI